MKLLTLGMSLALAAAGAAAEPAASDYRLRLRPDFDSQTIAGTEMLTLQRGGAAWPALLRWPLNGLHIEALAIEGQALPVRIEDDALLIDLPGARAGRPPRQLRRRDPGRPRRRRGVGPGYV
ncbi:MAG: hypothetical protein ABW005_03875 [Burkholderiaceae bacterium]